MWTRVGRPPWQEIFFHPNNMWHEDMTPEEIWHACSDCRRWWFETFWIAVAAEVHRRWLERLAGDAATRYGYARPTND